MASPRHIERTLVAASLQSHAQAFAASWGHVLLLRSPSSLQIDTPLHVSLTRP